MRRWHSLPRRFHSALRSPEGAAGFEPRAQPWVGGIPDRSEPCRGGHRARGNAPSHRQGTWWHGRGATASPPLRVRPLPFLALALLLAACGTDGAPQYGGGPPPVEAVYGQCAFCHTDTAARMVLYGGHGSLRVKCQRCHADLTPGRVGPEHASIPACADCHRRPQTHMDPAAGTPQQCLVCHTPHGSPNLFLVDEEITTPSETTVTIDFTNLLGKADGSFASASDPGTGLCEVCHSTTRYYNSEGDGEPHFTNVCTVCHTHAAAFAPTE